MHDSLITDLATVCVVAAATGIVFRRIGQPTILGYLLAGLIVGPYIPIPLFADPHRIHDLAEVGVVLVMFAIGLEFRLRRLFEILPVSGLTAFIQIATLWWAGYTVGTALDWDTKASMCLGACLAISSTMVVSAVLRTKRVDEEVRSHVFGILVVQDVAAIVLMAIVTALASGQSIGVELIGRLLGQILGVVVVLLVLGVLVLPRLVRFSLAQPDKEILVILIAAAAFGLAIAATYFGFSPALGAFIAGMAVAESGRGKEVEHATDGLRALFSAIFFVSIGMSVDPIVAWKSLPLALGLSGVVIGAQFVSVFLGTVLTGSSIRRGVYSGFSLGQIGELSFILATIAIGGNVMEPSTLPALVTVATITAFTTPFFLGRAQAIVAFVDHRLPDRVHQALTAYDSLIRDSGGTNSHRHKLRRDAAAALLDWLALVVIFVVRKSASPHIAAEFTVAANAVAVALAAPFVLGLLRSGARLATGVRAITRAAGEETAQSRAVETVAVLAVVVVLGVPTIALLTPLIEGRWAEIALVAVLLAVLVVLGFRLGKMERDGTSVVARIALDIEGRIRGTVVEEDGARRSNPGAGPLSGIDYEPVKVIPAGPGDGATLADLDLRCRTGATVVAIVRGGRTMPLPTGHEQLQGNDILAVSGSEEALERARELLTNDEAPVPVESDSNDEI